ncbi:MAG: hypothetical protein JWQ98_264 [Chlorobi bacterium]|nr:hypothetical protein [Chlorobiota bacterium]
MVKPAIALALLLAAIVAGCDGPGIAPTTGETGSMTARVNGRIWRSTTLTAAGRGTTTIALHGTAMTPEGTEAVDILLNDVVAAESYRLGDEGTGAANIAVYSSAGHSFSTITANSGTVRISEISSEGIKGMFGFSAGTVDDPSAVRVTEGSFSATFR